MVSDPRKMKRAPSVDRGHLYAETVEEIHSPAPSNRLRSIAPAPSALTRSNIKTIIHIVAKIENAILCSPGATASAQSGASQSRGQTQMTMFSLAGGQAFANFA